VDASNGELWNFTAFIKWRPHGYSDLTPVNAGPIKDVTFSRIPAKVILASHR
jgi:hypothetical protein